MLPRVSGRMFFMSLLHWESSQVTMHKVQDHRNFSARTLRDPRWSGGYVLRAASSLPAGGNLYDARDARLRRKKVIPCDCRDF